MKLKPSLNVLLILVFLVSYGCSANPSTQKTESATPVTIIGLKTPIILGYDLEKGWVEGLACSNCFIEVISKNSSGEETSEGQTIADEDGYFSFDKAQKFFGPSLVIAARPPGVEFSAYSEMVTGTSYRINFQEGNDHPKHPYFTKTSIELQDNRIGSQWDWFGATGQGMLRMVGNTILPAGLKRASLTVNGKGTGQVNWNKPEFSIDPEDDLVFTRLAENNVIITYVLTFWDKETFPNGEGAPCTRFTTEEEIQHYLDYVRFIVRHFKDRVQYFEIWNEPNNGWMGSELGYDNCDLANIAIDDYLNLVRRTVPVIREEYPEAKIVVASTMPQIELGSREYLFRILTSDIMPLVDSISYHPGAGPSPEYDYWRDYYDTYPSLLREIKDVATAHGFNGEFRADEMGWATETNEDVHWTYSDKRAAKYLARFTILHLGMDFTFLPGVDGPGSNTMMRFNTIKNLSTIMEQAKPVEMLVKIDSQAINIMSYAFSLPNGDRLFALWTHDAASDDDPSTKANLTFPNLSAEEVTAIDVLYGFKQKLITEQSNGNLVMRDVLIKDYPIVLHFKENNTP